MTFNDFWHISEMVGNVKVCFALQAVARSARYIMGGIYPHSACRFGHLSGVTIVLHLVHCRYATMCHLHRADIAASRLLRIIRGRCLRTTARIPPPHHPSHHVIVGNFLSAKKSPCHDVSFTARGTSFNEKTDYLQQGGLISQLAAFFSQHLASDLQQAAFFSQHLASALQQSASDLQLSAFFSQHFASGLQQSAPGLQQSAFFSQHFASGLQQASFLTQHFASDLQQAFFCAQHAGSGLQHFGFATFSSA